ncbi:hypothetical protein [Undibacterium sp. RuRC25W]|uniref:hypothetical protein n=1 Tax=Undibacterium sp. RuRC25W TaxID=3413047 RepID=UPI003BF169CB
MSHPIQLSPLVPDVAALKQKPPFRFVDYVESFDQKQGSIVAWMSRCNKDNFLSPDVLSTYAVLEALAQTCSFLVMSQLPTRRGYVVGFEEMRFTPPLSSAPFRLQANLLQISHPFYTLGIAATCDSQLVAQGKLRVYVEV